MTRDIAVRFWEKVDRRTAGECWPWIAAVSHGHGRFSMSRKEGMVAAHRVAFQLVNGTLPACVRHTCDNTVCVNPAHLVAGDHADNMRDMAERERSRTTRLTASDVATIRKARAGGGRQVDIARAWNVAPCTIGDIVARRTWRHVA